MVKVFKILNLALICGSLWIGTVAAEGTKYAVSDRPIGGKTNISEAKIPNELEIRKYFHYYGMGKCHFDWQCYWQ